ncbi:MAG: OmpA/MotB family protein [Phycisphaerales bacterium]
MAGLFTRFSGLAIGAVILGSLLAGGCAEQKEKQAALTEENTKLREQKEAMTQQLATADAAARQAQAEKDQALALLAQKNTQVQDPPRGGGGGGKPKGGGSSGDTVITVAGDVLFAPGQATLTAGGKKELDKVASDIKSRYSGHHIRVEGYTDSDPITKSKWSSNEELSSARAVAVEKYLSTKGVSKSRIEAVGMGAAKPKATKKDSRRVEIVIVGN